MTADDSDDSACHSSLEMAVVGCPPWTAHLLLRHGAAPARCLPTDTLVGFTAAVSKRQASEESTQLLSALLDAGAPLNGRELAALATSACGCISARVDPQAHLQQWSAMLRLLLEHGAVMQVCG